MQSTVSVASAHVLIEYVVGNRQSVEIVARWRFVEGALGTGIRGVHAVARLASSPSLGTLDLADVAVIMQHRIVAGWASFAIDMNDRVGLPFPEIDLQQGIVSN